MKKLILFVLGQKGMSVVKAAMASGSTMIISCVVVGQDRYLKNDCSDELVEICKSAGLKYCYRHEFDGGNYQVSQHIGLAAGWRWIIMLDFYQLIVFHDSLLPKYRGFNPLVTALINKDEVVGVTAIIANKEFDRGDIIASRRIRVGYPVKILFAIDSISGLYFDLTVEVLSRIGLDVPLAGERQVENEATYSLWRDDEDYRIDWSLSADEIVHFINCVGYPYAGASSVVGREVVRILDAEAMPDLVIENRTPGKVLFVDNGAPVVVCGRGMLKVRQMHNEVGGDLLPIKKLRIRFK